VKSRLLDPRGLFGFLLAQAGVFGPVFFAALVVGLGAAVRRWRRPGPEHDVLLICFLAPPLVLVLVQATLSRANANWAATAYVPASILVAAWLMRRRARWLIGAGIATQAAIAALFLTGAVWPAAGAALRLDNSFKVARGWKASTAWVRAQAQAASTQGPLSAVAVDDRFLFNALSYYGRDRPWPAPLRMWVREAKPRNQAETEAPLTPADGARVLMVDVWEGYREEAVRDFTRSGPVERIAIPLDRRRSRALSAFVGQGFAPQPRDLLTGLPTPP
jgi:4-amino-4-deoxy-L-arabinose transferase-like glycosyltransferase